MTSSRTAKPKRLRSNNYSEEDAQQNLNSNNNNNSNYSSNSNTHTTSLSSSTKKKVRERRYYLPKETLKQLKTDKELVKCIKTEFSNINAKFMIDYNSGQAVVQMKQMDNDRTLNILQGNVGIVITEAEFARLTEELISIERNREELTADPSQTISNVLGAISKGASFIKHSQFAKPKTQWFSFTDDRLYWKDNKNGSNHLNRSMEMKTIVKVRPGKTTKLLKSKKCNKIDADHCLSIIGVRKALDLQSSSRTERDEWFTYIEFAHRHWVRAKRKTMRLEDQDITLDELILDID